LYRAPNYLRVFFRYQEDHHAEEISEQLEAVVEVLSNTKDTKILGLLNELPIIFVRSHLAPFNNARWNQIAGILLPIGILLWWRIWNFRRRLNNDMKQIIRVCDMLEPCLEKLSRNNKTEI
jgi:lipopolysaccharide export system permease protein